MKLAQTFLILGLVMSASAHAATVSCKSELIFVVGMGGTETRATLEFTPGLNADGVAVLNNVKGSVEFPDFGYRTFAEAGAAATEEATANQQAGLPASVSDDQLVGSTIDQAVVTANTAYRPHRYTDSYQFKRIDTRDMPDHAEGIMDFTMMVPKAVFTSSVPSFQVTAEVQIDQNAARLVMDCTNQ